MTNDPHNRARKTSKTLYQRCRCGWVGTLKQLAIWLRKDRIVTHICPSCGTPAANQSRFEPMALPNEMRH